MDYGAAPCFPEAVKKKEISYIKCYLLSVYVANNKASQTDPKKVQSVATKAGRRGYRRRDIAAYGNIVGHSKKTGRARGGATDQVYPRGR